MTFHLRPVELPADYERIAELISTESRTPTTVANLMDGDRSYPADAAAGRDAAGLVTGSCRERVLAVDDSGRAVGFGRISRGAWLPPGRIYGYVVVEPAAQGQGAGTLILTHLENWARAQGADMVQALLRDDLPRARAYAERHGWTVARHRFESYLDLPTFDAQPFAGEVEAVAASGLRFTTLEEVTTPAQERQLYDVSVEAAADIPGEGDVILSFADWRREVLERPDTRRDWYLLAADGDRYVGLTFFEEDNPGVYFQGLTGVARSHRGRKIALALKLKALEVARAAGVTRLYTSNDAENAPMLAVNRKLGFVPTPGTYRIDKLL